MARLADEGRKGKVESIRNRIIVQPSRHVSARRREYDTGDSSRVSIIININVCCDTDRDDDDCVVRVDVFARGETTT